MPFADSYLWRLRQAVGSELVLMPGAMVALQRDDGQVLLTKRADDGSWCLPAGAAEVGGSFAQTAALCFLARRWSGDPRPDRTESTEVRFSALGAVPKPLHRPTARALELLQAYLDTGAFQLR
jgi:hypothetical protein